MCNEERFNGSKTIPPLSDKPGVELRHSKCEEN